MRMWEILMKISEYLMSLLETIQKISWENNKFLHSNQNFQLSHNIKGNMRKAADWSIFYLILQYYYTT